MKMQKKTFSLSRVAVSIVIVTIITCAIGWLPSSSAKSIKVKLAAAGSANPVKHDLQANDGDQSRVLVQRLINDKMVDESRGFTVVKKQNNLYINGQVQPVAIAGKYLQAINQDVIEVVVNPFGERLTQHPGASILQMVAPIQFSSPCVKIKTKKPGC